MRQDEEEGEVGRRGLGEFFSFPASVSWDAKREDLFARLGGGSDVPLYLRRPVQPLSLSPPPSPPTRHPRSASLRPAFYPTAAPVAPRFLPQRHPPTLLTSPRAMVDHV